MVIPHIASCRARTKWPGVGWTPGKPDMRWNLGAVGHVMNSRVARHGVAPRVARCGVDPRVARCEVVLRLNFCGQGQCSAGTVFTLTPRAKKETDIIREAWGHLRLLPRFTSDPSVDPTVL